MNTPEPKKVSSVVARLTVEFASGKREAYEIHADASFSQFYHQYVFISARKKSPLSVPTLNRSYSQPMNTATGLEGLQSLIKDSYRARTNPVKSSKIVIYKKRLYKSLITMVPDLLPGGGLPQASSRNLGPVIPKWDMNTPAKVSHVYERESRIFRKHPKVSVPA